MSFFQSSILNALAKSFAHQNAISKNVHSVTVRVCAFLHSQDPQRPFATRVGCNAAQCGVSPFQIEFVH